jgi:hypothetical protein
LIEHGGMAPRSEHRLLHHVFGASTIATRQADDIRPQRPGMFFVQGA